MPSFRQQRVSQRLHEEITLLFDRELSDPRLANVNVTRVEMSPDLRYARVYVAPQPTADESAQMMQGLEHAAGFIRRRLAQALALRLAPEIRFELDHAIEKAERFLQVLAQVEAEERALTQEKKPRAKEASPKKNSQL